MATTSRPTPQRPRDWLSGIYLPYNWAVGPPTVCCLFANIFFCVAAFGCSSFVARTTGDTGTGASVTHYGYWGFREQGQCQNFPVVDASLKLGRAFGIVGLFVGLAYLAFWISLWTIRLPRHVMQLASTTMATTMVIMTMTLYFMGPAFETCDSSDGDGWKCEAAGSGKLTVASTVFWFLAGLSVLFVADRPEESTVSRESDPQSNETVRLVRQPTSTTTIPTRAQPRPKTRAQPRHPLVTSVSSPRVIPHGPPRPAAWPVASAPLPPRLTEEVNYQPDGTKAVTTTKSYMQPDGTTVVERTTEFSDRPSSERIDEDDDDASLDAFKPNPQSQPPYPEFDEEHGRE